MIEQLSLFGPSDGLKEIKRTKRQEVFEGYDAFVEKFQTKKTTDDCYTPAPVYEAVRDFVAKTWGISSDTPIVRPFYPGGDYESFTYPEGCIVIDNPPFSLLSKIIRFYSGHNVSFFLWGPALTLFTAPDCDTTYIIADADITYENGAIVRTGFITNLPSDIRIWCCPELRNAIENAQKKEDKTKRGFIYPDNIVTAATLQKLTAHQTELKIMKRSCRYIKDSDSAKAQGRSLFGGGFILSERAAAERAAAERVAAERVAAESSAAERAAASRLYLSKQERYLIEELNANEEKEA